MLEPEISVRGSAQVSFPSLYAGGTTLYSVDGSDPAVFGYLYSSPFHVRRSCIVRAIEYNADFSESFASETLEITVLPTLAALSDGGGIVAVDPPSGAYSTGQMAMVTAVPSSGWQFLHWLGDLSGADSPAQLQVSTNRTVKGVFGTALHTNVVGSGSITISPASALYPYGTTIRLTGQPAPGSYFVRWGGASSETNNSLLFSVTNADPALTAVFALLTSQESALTMIASGNGRVDVSPSANRFKKGTNVVLTAVPDSGQSFLGWSGDASGAINPLTVMMTQSKVITANFSARPSLDYHAPLNGLFDQGFRFGVNGEFATRYRIERLTPALIWEPLGWLTNSHGFSQFLDAGATNQPAGNYRAVQD